MVVDGNVQPLSWRSITRKITAGLFISLDGIVEAPDQWHFPYFNEEMGAAVDATLGAADTMLFDRKTYDSFAGAWPDREAAGGEDAAFAKKLGDARKIVASNRPLEFTWRNSEQLQGDLVEAVTALKNQSATGTIGMSGSVSVVRQLLTVHHAVDLTAKFEKWPGNLISTLGGPPAPLPQQRSLLDRLRRR
ncbi:hypothetical protein U2F26_10015 [Micromonospora sp. 4G57]|uniref:Pyrimidine reductase n=1 Tax=Micromonospora sicca TaxID=2202420 RepID=A0ABU5J6S0_9ACTN|nr:MULTISPECIES: hypothetical protein [unclassified Micromonospora]MDZ5443063.1 hypothetical protein [Micromonospora sp. 4G57]MDZ5488225.1 hypothetical protein [Micromonospora sp. 4G53]